MHRLVTMLLLVMISHASLVKAQEPADSDRLEMAIAYFQSGKYHEALLLFEKLDKEYTLNPRFQGFMGVCYFHEWLYEEACKKLDAVMPQLEVFAPHERSVYYFTAGESHFELKHYAQAIPHYEKALTVCYDNEKGEIYYRLGLCYMFLENWQPAYEHFEKALDYLIGFQDTPEMQARIKQTAHMMAGCKDRMKKETGDVALSSVSDSIEVVSASDTIGIPEDIESVLIGENTNAAPQPTDSLNFDNGSTPIVPSQMMAVGTTLNDAVQKMPSTPIQPVTEEAIRKRVVRTQKDIPSTQNLEHLYEQKVEVQE